MTTRVAAAGVGSLDADMFHGPPRLRALTWLLRRCPRPLTERLLATLAVVNGLARPERFRQASAWAAKRGATGWERRRLALAVLANHGRFVADEMLGTSGTHRDEIVVIGEEHLRAVSRGAILLGFHLGPPKTWRSLRALGYPLRFAGRLEGTARDPRWQAALDAGEVIRLPAGAPEARVRSLLQIRNFLRDGALIYVTADGPFGREAFRIDLQGGPLIIRTGWLALRRATGVPTLPVLTYREGHRRVIVIHPPLEASESDPVQEASRCKAALAPLIEEYVRRFPSQCRWVAMPRWSRPPAASEAESEQGRLFE